MLEATLGEAVELKRIIDSIRDMLGECNFECTENGISLQSLDKSHIVLVSLQLTREAFSEYRCDEGSLTLGINITSLNTVLRCGNDKDVLTLRAAPNANELTVTFEDTSRDRVADFNLRLMDIEQEYLSIPETQYPVSVTLASADLQRILRDLKTLSESVEIDVDKDRIRFTAEGEIGKGNVTLKPVTDAQSESKNVVIHAEEPVKLSFNLQYFTNICKSAALSDVVTIQMASGMPAEIQYRLASGHVRYYFAPKIEDDE